MKKNKLFFMIISLLLTVLFSVEGFAVGSKPGSKDVRPGDNSKGTAPLGSMSLGQSKLFFKFNKKPGTGMPRNRISLASRGKKGTELYMAAIVPLDTGLTIKSKPKVCWFLSTPVKARIEFTISEESAVNPLLETTVKNITDKGVQCIDLAKHNVSIKAGLEYRWYVSIVVDEKERSKDLTDGGFIKMIEASSTLKEKLASVKGKELVRALAEEGIWYDTFSEITGLVEKAPSDKDLRLSRANLLEQIGLKKVATLDLN